MAKVLMLTSCRCDSERVPNKVILNLGGKPTFVHVLERGLEGYPNPDYIAVVTPQEMVNDPLEMLARQYGYDVVRKPKGTTMEQLAVLDEYGLEDDDIYIPLSGDSPLQYAKHLAFAVEKLQEHDAQVATPVIRRGTLAYAGHACGAARAGYYRHIVPRAHLWARGATYGLPGHEGRYVFVELPAYLQAPWPWAALQIDWPLQAVALRAIYEELYDGTPIDLRDVMQLYSRNPLLANLVPVDAPLANQPGYPQGAYGLLEQTIKNTGNYVEVKFEEEGHD